LGALRGNWAIQAEGSWVHCGETGQYGLKVVGCIAGKLGNTG